LIGLAKQCFAQAPDEPMGGLVLIAGSPLGKLLARTMPPEQRAECERQNCITAMPRDDFDKFIRLEAPEVVDALPERDPASRRTGRTLPVLIATEHGNRLACLVYDID
jgi:hypothetical protein